MAIRMSGLASNMDTESIVKELMSAQRYKETKLENKTTKTEWTQEKWKDLNSKVYSFYTTALAKTKMKGSYDAEKATSSNENKVTVTSAIAAPEGNHKIVVESVASSQIVTGAQISSSKEVTEGTKLTDLGMTSAVGSSITITAGTKTEVFEIKSESTLGDFVSAMQDAGLYASYDKVQKRFFISSKQSGTDNSFSLKASSSDVDLSKLGLSEITAVKQEDGTVGISASSNVKVVPPSDAIIRYNGAELKSASNTIKANGLTFTVKEKSSGLDTTTQSDDEVININVAKDTQAIYDMVKDFIKSYNDVVKSMNDAYYADTAKGYEPLTDDQKKVMSETEVTKWEDKIKNSLLRRDSTLDTLINSFQSTYRRSVSYDGKNYSLESFGISSPVYTEKGLYHIDGNSEDSLTGFKEDKLKKAISENPDAVREVFTKLGDELYTNLSKQMKSTTLRSALSVYNDKEMKSTVTSYKKEIKDMEKRLTEKENNYYKRFTAMETALSKLNSQSSSLTSMLGTSTK
jgi:Flagellar capping protein